MAGINLMLDALAPANGATCFTPGSQRFPDMSRFARYTATWDFRRCFLYRDSIVVSVKDASGPRKG
jgi:hypothetical protein